MRIKMTETQEKIKIDETTVTRKLFAMGIKPNLKGFRYIRTAILEIANDEELMHMAGRLCAKVANVHETTASKVERAIRHAKISAGINKVNSEFLAETYETLRLEIEKNMERRYHYA